MQEKGKFSKKIKLLLFLIVFFKAGIVTANNIKQELQEYNMGLKNSFVFFIQTDGETVEEGVVYIGSKRIKIEYKEPKKISIVLSKNNGMYVNHELKETQFFNTNKSFVKIFFNILTGTEFFEKSKITSLKKNIIVKKKFTIDEAFYFIEIVYEDNPVKLRKVKIKEDEGGFEIGFYNHTMLEKQNKKFFALIDPYLNN